LCKVEHFKTPENQYRFDSGDAGKHPADDAEIEALKKRITRYLLSGMIQDPPKENIDALKETVLRSVLPAGIKAKIVGFIESGQTPPDNINNISTIIAGLYDYSGNAVDRLNSMGTNTIDGGWAKTLFDEVTPPINDFPEQMQQIIMRCIIMELSRRSKSLEDLPERWLELGRRS
jgi:hypothetical protein